MRKAMEHIASAEEVDRDSTFRLTEQALRERDALQAGQREAMQAALNDAPLETSLGILVRTAIEQLGDDTRAAFYLANPEGTKLHHVVGMHAEYAKHIDGFKIGPESLSCGLATHSGQPVLTSDVREEPLWQPWLWLTEQFDFRGCWSFPIHTTVRRFVGTLAIYWRQPRQATQRELDIASLLIETAAIIISRHIEAEARRSAEARLESELADWKLLQSVSAEIVQQENVEVLYEKIIAAAVQIMRSDFASMQMLYPERGQRGELRLLACHGYDLAAAKFWEWVRTDSGCTCGVAMRTGQRAIAADIQTCDFMMGTPDQANALRMGMLAMQSTPLVARSGKLVGMISTHWKQPHTPSERDLRLLDILARQAADLLERIRGEEALRTSEERYRTLFESMDEGYCVIEFFDGPHGPLSDYVHVEANPAYTVNAGIPDIVGKKVREMVPDEADGWVEIYRNVLLTGEPVRFERELVATGRHLELSAFRVEPVQRRQVAVMFKDITARKQAEAALRAAHTRLQKVLEVETVGVMFWDLTTGRMTDANDAFLKMMGYSRAEVTAGELTWQKLTPPEYVEVSQEEIRKFQQSGRVGPYEKEYLRKDGTRQWLVFAGSSLGDNTCVEFCVDIADRKLAEQVLDQAREAAEKATVKAREAQQAAESANRAKDKFLAVLSHELRTPLTPVLMAVAAMDMNPDLAPAIRGQIAMIRRNIELEAKLIDDLLDLSRVMSGKLRLNMDAVDVTSAIRHVVETCRPNTLEKAIRLHVDLPDRPSHVKADPARLQQILWNLLKNAAKFTPERGDIYVTASIVDERRVRVEVRDTGVGIPAEVLPKIFDAFEQGDDSITKQFGGMGLGLAISKALAGMHGGTIRAESPGRDRGSTFTLELPLCAPHEVPAQASRPRTSDGDGQVVRVLVVEDHIDTAEVLCMVLEVSGYSVKSARSAAAALELAGKEQFDVIVSDIGLPDATGYELMRDIRSRYPMKGIAMSGYGMDEDLRKSREAGFSDHVVKPATAEQLDQSIRRVVGKR